MQGLKVALGLAEEKPKTAVEEMEEACCDFCPKLTYQQRVGGYIGCFVVSILLSIGAFTRLIDLVRGNPAPFVIFYTMGNILAIIGSLFLSGPKAQCRSMWDKTRRIATSIYFSTIITTLFVCFYKKIPDDGRIGIIIMCILIQWVAMLWYTISYIPYARDYVCMLCCKAPKAAVNSATGRR
ncbi:Got1/Sft2-like family-domain-containing protein [Pelagophyceae sp. CCMP2097]|nr:Got1/Sft2-like family-domain-containing protein [Pelagophyceae sp. CCMP2097]